MINTLVITHGVSGSGKSTMLKEWLNQPIRLGSDLCYKDVTIVCATDDYWIRPDGTYDWNRKLHDNAVEWNLNRINQACQDGCLYVVADSTNLTFRRVRPILDIARDCHYYIEVMEPQTSWRYDADELFFRNTHGLSLESIKEMLAAKEPIEELRVKINKYMEQP